MSSLAYDLLENDPLVGRVLDEEYRVLGMIGRGGVGVVYLAVELRTGKPVVVKFLSDALLGNARAVARFEREAKRLDGIVHPNIVRMHGHGHDGTRAWLVMEYVPGMLLSDLIAIRGRLGLREFVPIAAQILNGIGHAHSRELMLRDIKPSNVMLCQRKGRANFVKILDFGLAKQLHDELQITQDHVMGTVGYVAPEALCGKPADLRVDIYAVGVLFYQMLCGHLPFEGENNAAIFYKTVHEQAPDLETRLPECHGIPRRVIDLVQACLNKRPEDRPRDANALLERLVEAVPASYFRLPPAPETTPTQDEAVGNTGMIHLVETTSRRAPGRSAGFVALAGVITAVACVLALWLLG